ncbi:sensor histidine kinase [Bacteroides sp.]|uniref:sensor histidine kinase n=1 Tax=Bacteroides sp. TaxID=29523 RepID=UPI00261FF655|nr:histidine kinase [Bacteroides sp.]MDD3039811.1 histidine kinase [Bacteroides sp.]
MKQNHILYSSLFSGLGVFSFFLLANYAGFSDKVSDALYSVGTLLFFIIAFNLLGYSTIRLSTWIDNQYSVNLHRRWKLIFVYAMVMLMFFLLNYSLLVTAKFLVGVSRPFVFPHGGWRILIIVWLAELVILGLLLANRTMQHTLKLQKQAAALQEENNIARYTALQNQLNPHFLFNSLNTLISEIRYNPKNAELFTQHLSDVYRYILQCQNQRLATLQDELGFLDSYIFLHQVRLGDCIHVHNHIPAEWKEMKLPPLTLQLLVENVIKHNVIHSGKPMVIELTGIEEPLGLIISNVVRPKKCGSTSGMGLNNLSARYKLLCNKSIVIEQESDKFIVKIPLLQ